MNFMKHSRFAKVARWTIIGAVAGELAAIVGTFYLYSKMQTSRELRKKLYDFDHRFLDAYYDMNTKLGNPNLKKQDAVAWGLIKPKDMTSIK